MAEKRRVSGVVDRIEGSVVVVLVKDPRDPEMTIEVYVPRSKIKKVELEEGDRVSVLV
ncbi:MAG: hypothetical protein BWY66_02881 [bacterium ADurb.Bin374]|nr:MAG: hypothetical protein BWY66_02881 [bacterium ADurb.Bin374]